MKSIRLLHITDLHFGKEIKSDKEESVDKKDKAISPEFYNKINTHWTHDFIEAVKNWERITHTKINGIVFTGDLGIAGNSESIEKGVIFLNLLCQSLEIEKDNLILCPGNHDLQRDNIDTEFKIFEDHLRSNGYTNFSSYEKICKIKINNISIYSVNSCLGGVEQSLFIKKYKDIIKDLGSEEKDEFVTQLNNLKQDYLADYLDIPAIGTKQIDDLVATIGNSNSDSAIVLMHHNIMPNNSIEMRPYSNIIDGGKAITSLMNTRKKIFILHGHTHFEYNIVASFPEQKDNFVSTIGCGSLNEEEGTKSNILEFYFSENDKHLITKVHSLFKFGTTGYKNKFSYDIYEKTLSRGESKIKLLEVVEEHNILRFDELKQKTNSLNDDELLKVLLTNEHKTVSINKGSTDDYNNWIISKKNN